MKSRGRIIVDEHPINKPPVGKDLPERSKQPYFLVEKEDFRIN